MIVYFVRHGIAADAHTWGGSDADRPLTDEGRKKMEKIARRFAELQPKPDLILSSPLLRAKETAEIVADACGKLAVIHDDRLAEGFGPEALRGVLRERQAHKTLVLVGHEPSMSTTIGHAVGSAHVDLKKGAIACVEFTNPVAPQGLLLWLAPPKVLIG